MIEAAPPDTSGTRLVDGSVIDESASVLEQRGIEYIPPAERRGKPSDVAWMWAAVATNISGVIYGAVIVSLGVSFVQAAIVCFLANLSWFLVGVTSLTGPAAGTTAFAISRAPFGPNGNRGVGVLNWMMMLGFEIFGMSTVTLAALALLDKFGSHQHPAGEKVAIIVVGTVLLGVLPFLGHKALLRTLKWLVPLFVLLFVLLAILAVPKAHLGGHGAAFATLAVAFALATSGSGLSYTVQGADYSRYLPSSANKSHTIWYIGLAGFIPTTLLMILGALVATTVPTASDPISGLPHVFAGWFLVPYLLCILIQQETAGSIVLYSSGVTLQAVGIRLKRVWCIAIDVVICCGATIAIIFSSSFNTYVSDFLLFMIVWFAPWCAITIIDYLLRRGRYDSRSLLDTRAGLYWRNGGFHLPGVVAQVLGMVASAMWIDTSIWKGPISSATNGVDMSVFMGLIFGGAAYYLLARTLVPAEGAAAERAANPDAPTAIGARLTDPQAQPQTVD